MGGPGGIKKDLKGNEKAVVTFVVFGAMNDQQRQDFNAGLKKLIDGFQGQITGARIDPKAPGDP
jgi:hypothetical protein